MTLPITEKAPWLPQTKFRPPRLRDDVIPRQRLTTWLCQVVTTKRLVLLSAPAGYGKTTLLAALPQLLPEFPLAWLALDEQDNDPNGFLMALLGALQTLDPRCGATTQTLLPAFTNPTSSESLATEMRRLMGVFINDILETLPEPFALVLDDLHVIAAPALHLALDYLLEHRPPQMHLVVATRRDPPLALPLLRARQQLAELRWQDLCFTPQEATEFLNQSLALNLSPEDLARLQRRTEGWAAGLSLLANSLEGLSTASERADLIAHLSETDRHVFDFLAEEVLQQQATDVRTFLIQTSILTELTPDLCQAVTGRPDAVTILEDLYRRNVFAMAVDEKEPSSQGRSYRYHTLFAEFLRHTLVREQPAQITTLHRRAALAQSTPGRAIHHYAAAQMWEAAAQTIEESGERIVQQGLVDTLVGWIRRLPSSLQETRPQLSYLLGLCALQKGELEAARSLLERAARGFEAAGDAAGQGAALATLASAAYLQLDSERSHALVTRALQSPLSPAMRVQALMTRASLGLFFAGNWEQVTDDFEAAIGLVRESDDPVALFALTLYLGQEFSLLPDGLERLESLCQEIQAQLGEALTPLHLGLEDAMAFIHFRRGRLAQAIQAGERLLAVKERLGGYPFVGVNSAMIVAQVYAAQEAYAFANHYLELMQSQVDQVALNRLTVAGGLYPRAKILWLQGRIAQARQVYAQMCAACGPSETPLLHALRVMARGLLEVSDREYAAAAHTFQQAIALEQSVRLVSIFDCPPLLLAHLYRLWQRPGAALDVLSPLLARCAAAETPGAVLQAGAIVVPLLQLAIEREVHAPYAAYLLGLLDAPVGPATIAVPETGATLTKRELDVLRLLATGASNQAIAERLVISLPTVKSHVSHILAKLAVSSRGQAAARARELHII